MRANRAVAMLVAVAMAPAACSYTKEAEPEEAVSPTDGAGTSSTLVDPGAATTTTVAEIDLGAVSIELQEIAALEAPTAMAVRAGDPSLYIAQQDGVVRRIEIASTQRNTTTSTSFQLEGTALDLRRDVLFDGEQGLLGIAFSTDGNRLYAAFTGEDARQYLVEFQMGTDAVEASTRREVLVIDDPYANHNGGQLGFGPDGHLYVALGDGGSGGDPANNAQNPGVLLGKILRLDPRPGGGRPYSIPTDNPFASDPSARPEVWALGLRNPWRFSFDRATGDFWIGDVGQNRYEEVDFATASGAAGANYGWDRLEGRHAFEGEPPAGHVLPIHEYRLTGVNCAVTGGYVYRGSRIPGLRGTYLFADFCEGQVMGLRQQAGEALEVRPLSISAPQLASFGEDLAGELYVLSLSGGLFRVESA